MTEQQIKQALEEAAGDVTLPARFRRPSALVQQALREREESGRRPKLFKRLEFAVACVVLLGALGLTAARLSTTSPAPGGGITPPVQVANATGSLVGTGSDGTVKLEVALFAEANGSRRLFSIIRNLSDSPVELRYECDNLIRLNGLTVRRDCDPLPAVKLQPGQSGQEEIFLPASTVQNPTVGSLVYAGPGAAVKSLTVTLVPGGPDGTDTLAAADVVARLRAAGLQVTEPVQSKVKLFGAKRVDTLTVQGKDVSIYTFATKADALAAMKTASDPQANTIEWAEEPQFFVQANLLIVIVSNDKWVTKQAILALDDGPPPIILKPFIQNALELARAVDNTIPWEAHLIEQSLDVTIQGVRVQAPVWIVEGKKNAEQATVLYFDARSGRLITRVEVAAPGSGGSATPEEAVSRYLTLTSSGRYQAAWTLLDPVSQKPNPAASLGLSLARFYALEGTTGPGLKEILSVQLPENDMGTKDPSCMCYLRKATVQVQLMNGTTTNLQVVAGANGKWGVMWRWSQHSDRTPPRRLSATLRSSGGATARVYLEAPDEQVQLVDAPSCMANRGDTLRTGTYAFYLLPGGSSTPEKQSIDPYPGEQLTFNDQRPHYLQVLPGGPGIPDLLLVWQYGACNADAFAVLGLSPDGKRLVQYQLKYETGELRNTAGSKGIEAPQPGGLRTTVYNNATGKTLVRTWELNEPEGVLVLINTEER